MMDSNVLEHSLKNESTRHMHQGIALMERSAWSPALEHFEQAIRLREQLPWQQEVASAWLLAAAWLNRSDALRHQEEPALFPEALVSLEHCIAAMTHVPLAENPAYPERLILAWINRASILGEMGDMDGACEDFMMAEGLLSKWGENVTASRMFQRAMLSTNRARLLLMHGQPRAALEDTQAAIVILSQLNAVSAEIKARSIQCRALALLLEEKDGAGCFDDWIALATDTTEEALALVKASGYLDFWVSDLVRYGAKIYRACQPQFLAEFICEWTVTGPLEKDKALKGEMKNELLLAQMELEQRVLTHSCDTEYVQSQIKILKTLQEGIRRGT